MPTWALYGYWLMNIDANPGDTGIELWTWNIEIESWLLNFEANLGIVRVLIKPWTWNIETRIWLPTRAIREEKVDYDQR